MKMLDGNGDFSGGASLRTNNNNAESALSFGRLLIPPRPFDGYARLFALQSSQEHNQQVKPHDESAKCHDRSEIDNRRTDGLVSGYEPPEALQWHRINYIWFRERPISID